MSFNKVILMGNLTAEPELKATPSGVSVITFTIAVARRYAKESDPVKADFINIVAWRQTAEFVARYFQKGSSILVWGAIQTRSYADKDNKKRYITEVVADEVSFVGKKSNNPDVVEKNQAATGTENNSNAYPISLIQSQLEEIGDDEDLPFLR